MKAPVKKTTKRPMAILVYGTEGVGKTTFALKAPACVLLGNENGSDELDVPVPGTFDAPRSWMEFLSQIKWLYTNKHEYQTAVIDSVDWLEPLIEADILNAYPGHTMETAMGGFQIAWKASIKYWRNLTTELNKLREAGMGVILIAHSDTSKFNDAANQAEYSKYQLKLYKPAAALLKEWVDALLFANFEVSVDAKKNQKTRASGSGERRMYTEHRPGFDAKNRYGLPFDMEFSWEAFAEARGLNLPSPHIIQGQINDLLSKMDDKERANKIWDQVMAVSKDNVKLDAYRKRVEEILKEQGQ